jgi:hypothetical protein
MYFLSLLLLYLAVSASSRPSDWSLEQTTLVFQPSSPPREDSESIFARALLSKPRGDYSMPRVRFTVSVDHSADTQVVAGLQSVPGRDRSST